ncbi:Protein of unknown function, partial [Gryllus bimaculatus]
MRFFFCVLATVVCSVLVLGQEGPSGDSPPPAPANGTLPPPPGNGTNPPPGNGTNPPPGNGTRPPPPPGNGTRPPPPPPSNSSRVDSEPPRQGFLSQLAGFFNREGAQRQPGNGGFRRPEPFFGRFQQNQQNQQNQQDRFGPFQRRPFAF